MKKFCLLLFLCLSVAVFSQKADDIIGTWLTGSEKAKVQIFKSGDKYYGTIVWLRNPTYEDGTPKVDKNNPDKSKQGNTIVGLNMLKNFSFDEDEWNGGTIYDPENGKLYSCKISIRDGNKLDVRGYIGISLLGRTETWFKVADVKK